MGEWMVLPLGAAGVAVLDCEHRTPRARSEGYPYIAIPEIQEGRVVTQTARRISASDLAEWTRRTRPSAGDLIVTRRGRVGDSAPVPSGLECAIGQNLVLLRSDGSMVDQGYLRWAARSPAWWSEVARVLNVGAVFSSLNVRDIARVRLPLPPLHEQRAIADVLGALDDKIAANARTAAAAGCLGRAVYSVATVDGVSARLGDLTTLVVRGIAPRYTDDPAGTLVINQKCIRDGVVSLSQARRTEPNVGATSKFLQVNDVLINSTGIGTLGRVARWQLDCDATADSHVSIVRPDPGLVDPVCASYSLLLSAPAIEALGQGSTGQTELSRQALCDLTLRLPSPAHQDIVGRQLAALDGLSTGLAQENLTLAATRDALLPALMSGALPVRDAERAVSDLT